MRWNRMKMPSAEAVHLSTKQDLAGQVPQHWPGMSCRAAWGHLHDRWEGGSVHAGESLNHGASIGTKKIVVGYLSICVWNWTPHSAAARGCQPAEGSVTGGWLFPCRGDACRSPEPPTLPERLLTSNAWVVIYLFTDHYSLLCQLPKAYNILLP